MCSSDLAASFDSWARRELAWAAAGVVGGQLEADKIAERVISVAVVSFDRDAFPSFLLRSEAQLERRAEHTARQREVLFDLVGNPFQPIAFDPAWRTSTVLTLARTMLDTGDFSAMPILADALQDAGCEDKSVLTHCRGDGPHFRGCWVVDGILDRN